MTTSTELEQLRFPIGHFVAPTTYNQSYIDNCIAVIEAFPNELKKEVVHLSDDQLNTVYRPEGWTIRQVIHHCADSHINSLIRFKLTLTEDKPVVKPYMEDRWAELADSKDMPIASSLALLEGLHKRWGVLLRAMNPRDFEKTFIHPEHGRQISLYENIGIYEWHCKHHLAHITHLKKRMNWH